MQLSFTTIDVFTHTRYTGNPLAIVHLPFPSPPLTQAQKQSIALEFNLSETVFVHDPPSHPSPAADAAASAPQEITIDIFTPYAEIPFAGHPTIGTAWYLLHHHHWPLTSLRTKAGPIPITTTTTTTTTEGAITVRAQIPHAVHIHAATATSPLTGAPSPLVSIVKGMTFVLAELASLEALAAAKESVHAETYEVGVLDEGWREGLIGTLFYVAGAVRGGGRERERAFRTRMHASREDPATGSASAALGAYLALGEEGVGVGEGVFRYVLTQGVEMGRRGEIVVEVERRGRGEIESIFLSGGAVKVMEGKLEV